jgi:uncharacterized protein (DUF302 family)
MDPVFSIDTRKPIERVRANLESACARHRFGVMGVHDVRAKLAEKGFPLERDCVIYEVCSPPQAKKVLDEDPRISTALPCRISVWREGEAVRLGTIRPTLMLAMFGAEKLTSVAEEVERTLTAIMEEAAREEA